MNRARPSGCYGYARFSTFGLASAAPASAQVVNKASLRELSVQLIDLDPGDGITPSISWMEPEHGSRSRVHLSLNDGTDYWRMKRYARGSAAFGQMYDSQVYHSTMTAGLSMRAVGEMYSGTVEGTHVRTESWISTLGDYHHAGATVSSGLMQFVLSPNTRLSITAAAMAGSSVGPLFSPDYLLAGHSQVSMSLWSGLGSDFTRYHDELSASVRDQLITVLEQRRFTLGFDNLGMASSEGALYISSHAYSNALLLTPVPEPVTYAMLLAGMTILGAAGALRGRRS